jgi:hypothetical protein
MRLAVVLVMLAVVLGGCVSEGTLPAADNASIKTASIADCTENIAGNISNTCALPDNGVEKVEVIHFHGNYQCYSCVTMGDYAEETINEYFAGELASGKISFAHINAQLPENAEITGKYGVTGSSLWIGVYDSAGFHAEQNTRVWYKLGNKKEYASYLKSVIEGKLEGRD